MDAFLSSLTDLTVCKIMAQSYSFLPQLVSAFSSLFVCCSLWINTISLLARSKRSDNAGADSFRQKMFSEL